MPSMPVSIRSRARREVHELIRVIRHSTSGDVADWSRRGRWNSRSIRAGVGPSRSGSMSGPRLELGVAVGLGLDDLRIDAQRRIVDERAVVHARKVESRGSTPSVNASSAPRTSSRSRPRSSAKWFRVPAGMQTWATSRRAATVATSACEPSPPAIPMTCAPRATALGELRADHRPVQG